MQSFSCGEYEKDHKPTEFLLTCSPFIFLISPLGRLRYALNLLKVHIADIAAVHAPLNWGSETWKLLR